MLTADFLLHPISDLANDQLDWIRRTIRGGKKEVPARHKPQGVGSDNTDNRNFKQPNFLSTSHTALAARAGGPCSRLAQAEFFSLPACRTVRLLVADSSISARMACRSSEAEITGNNRTSAHPRASKHCSEVTRTAVRARVPPPQPVSRQRQQNPRQIEQQFHRNSVTSRS